MSIQAVAWALEQEDVPARPKLVLVSICNHANHTDGYCWLNVETIAREAACSRRAVFNFVGDLIRNGFLRKAMRKGEDGKQRANDYWVLLGRPEAKWIKAQRGDDDAVEIEGDEPDAEMSSAEDAGQQEPQDVASRMHPVHAAESGENVSASPPEIPAGAPGPHAHGCTPIESAEPSESNPKARSARASGIAGTATRHYRPPPPQPMGADLAQSSKPIFVYVGTPAFRAWAIRKSIENRLGLKPNGDPKWHCESRAQIDGQWRTGWYFPTLFPPARPSGTGEESKPPTGPPTSSAA